MISDRAHRNGLAAAQKNAGELGELGRLLGGLDFAGREIVPGSSTNATAY